MNSGRLLLGILLLLALAGGTLLYLQPGFLVMLAGQVWACF